MASAAVVKVIFEIAMASGDQRLCSSIAATLLRVLLPMKLEIVNLFFKIMVYVLGILPLLLEKVSGVGVLPHDYVNSFAANLLHKN